MKEASSILVTRNISHGTKKQKTLIVLFNCFFTYFCIEEKKYFDAKQSER
jgi:hypothetical protein